MLSVVGAVSRLEKSSKHKQLNQQHSLTSNTILLKFSMNIRYATKRPTVKRNNTVPIILALLCSDKHPPHFSDAILLL